MVCIYCGNPTAVSNSRHQKRNNTIWRRRTCQACRQIFTTIERPDLFASVMFSVAGRLEGFNRDALFISVYEACKHRPDPLNDSLGLTQTMISDLMSQVNKDGTITRSQVITTAHRVLGRFDPVAATVYAAFHK